MRNFEYYVEFDNKETMWKFLFLYKDLLIPFADEDVRRITKQYGEETGKWMRFGIHIYSNYTRLRFFNREGDGVLVGIKMNSSDFNNIKGNFRKERIERYKMLYVLERMGL